MPPLYQLRPQESEISVSQMRRYHTDVPTIFSHGTLKTVFVHENEFPCLQQELLHMYYLAFYFVLRISIVLLIPSRKLYKGTKPKDKSL